MHFSISARSGTRWLQRLQFCKYYVVLEWENRFTLRMDAAKNTDYINQFLKQKLLRTEFSTKNPGGRTSLSLPQV